MPPSRIIIVLENKTTERCAQATLHSTHIKIYNKIKMRDMNAVHGAFALEIMS